MSRFTIGELARSTGVSVDTVRYYEKRGLLSSDKRTAMGWRRFETRDARRVKFIKAAQRASFSLAEIRTILASEGSETICRNARRQALDKIQELEERIHELNGIRSLLLEAVESCEASTDPPTCRAFAELEGT